MNNLDNKIKKALENNINITTKDEQDVWNNIQSELYSKKKGKENDIMKSNRKSLIQFIAAAAAIVILFIGSNTEVGHAIVSQIKEIFAPEKEITQKIEGNQEKTDVHLHQPTESNYIIYVDEERYEFIEGKETDKIIMKGQSTDIPEVSMEIKQLPNQSPEDVIKDLELSIKKEYETVHGPESVTDPLVGWTIRGLKGQKWNSPVIKVYVISNESQGSFVITQRYFLEASEGHGVRFDDMVKEFKIVE